MKLTGQCMCGAIKYQAEGPLPSHDGLIPLPVACHCKACQRVTGSAFTASIAVPTKQLEWLSGEASLKPYQSSSGVYRSFCAECGSNMTYRDDSDPDNVFVQLGTVDEPFDHKLQSHIFVGNKASWYDIHDDLVQFPAYPED